MRYVVGAWYLLGAVCCFTIQRNADPARGRVDGCLRLTVAVVLNVVGVYMAVSGVIAMIG